MGTYEIIPFPADMATASSRVISSSMVRSTATTATTATTTSSTSYRSSTVTTSSFRISTSQNPPSSPLPSSSSFLSRPTSSSSIASLIPVTIDGGSGEISKSSVIAIAVVFSVVGIGILLCLVGLFVVRGRYGMRQKDDALKGAPRVIFTHYPESLNSRLQVVPPPYDHPGDLQSWINARMDESGNEGARSSTLASPANSDVPELAVYKPGSPSASSPPKVPRKPIPHSAMESGYSEGQSTLSSLASPSRGSNGVVSRAEASPIPNGRSHVGWNHASNAQDRMRGSPSYERASSELFYATSTHVQAPLESSPTPSSMCIHERSNHSHEELRGVKIGSIARNVPLVYFPQDHEGHISARASMHSGNTHVAHNMHGFQRTRTSSLPLAQVRKARSVENIGAMRKPQALRRPSRKEVPRYVLDEFGQPVDALNSVDHPGSQLASHSMPFKRPKLHSKSRSVSMAPAIPGQ